MICFYFYNLEFSNVSHHILVINTQTLAAWAGVYGKYTSQSPQFAEYWKLKEVQLGRTGKV